MRHYGVLGGSDLVKIMEQLGRTVITDYDYVVAHTNGELIGTQSLKSFLGEDKLKTWISQLKGCLLRGTFIEFRRGMINVSPIGRNCSQE
ncbi:phosphomannomutase-like isoform X8 [Panicum virgatum]|uniref:phosphomannomutase-like isoform X8 n=1 Tax=Panicum virgatum TaxID=38727 RepID=UPI0019D6418C|nr:phosphomannomutase-like isoform X8 [Panicum virgatum]